MSAMRGLRGSIGLVCAGFLALAVAGCGAEQRADPAELDRYQADGAAFFEQFAPGEGASEHYYYETFAEAAKGATAIAVAEIKDVRLTRTVVSHEEPRDKWPMIGIDLRIVEVIGGDPPDELTVEFQSEMGLAEDNIDAMREAIPPGQALWFLRSKDDAYKSRQAYYEERGEEMPEQMKKNWEEEKGYWTPVSFQGVFIQDEQGVASAVAGDQPSGMAAASEQYERLSDLVDDLRQLEVDVGSEL